MGRKDALDRAQVRGMLSGLGKRLSDLLRRSKTKVPCTFFILDKALVPGYNCVAFPTKRIPQ